MSEDTENKDVNATSDEVERPDEMMLLKARARTLGLRISPKISLDTLREKVQAALNGEPTETDEEEEPAAKAAPDRAMSKIEREAALRKEIRDRELRLVRVRITNLNPAKRDLKGEILTVANRYIGNVKKYVPFGEETEDGYHVPFCLYTLMKDRKFLQLRSYENRKTKQTVVEQKWVPEFSLEVLPQLTPQELVDLAKIQAARGSAE